MSRSKDQGTMVHDTAKQFDADYYAHNCGQPYERNESWLAFFGGIAERIVQDIQPGTVLDAGCAMGFLVETLRQRGVEAWGIDISDYAIERVHPTMQPYCAVGSVAAPLPQRYDLIVSIEVLEHMPPGEAEAAIANFCQHSDDILFSSSPHDYKEVTHFNVQPPERWAELFARHGFYRDVDFDASFITPWAVRFRRRHEPPHRLAREYERHFWRLANENQALRQGLVEMRAELQAARQQGQLLQAQLAGIERGRVWRLMATFHRLRTGLLAAYRRLRPH